MNAPLRDEDFNKTSNYDRTFKQIKKVNDPRFGEALLYQDPNSRQQLIVRERKYNDKTEAGKAIMAARARMANQNPYQLKMLDYSATKQSELCSTIYVVRQYWEAPANDLKRELQNRMTSNQPFTEAELSNILYQSVKADSMGLHGDISPINMTYDRSNGNVRLIDRSDEIPSPQRTVNLQKAKIISSSQNLYQSPMMYGNLKKNNLKFNFDPTKEDAFALGLTMLELGNLKSVSNIYNPTTKEVDRNALAAHLAQFRTRYPNAQGFLNTTVDGLTRFDENQRVSVREVDANLPSEAEFRSRLASGAFVSSAPGGLQQTTTTTTYNTAGGMAGNTMQTIDVQSRTTPTMAAAMPSIYEMGQTMNEYYTRPNLPPIQAPSAPAPTVAPRYTPLIDNTPETIVSSLPAVAPTTTTVTKTTTNEVVINAPPPISAPAPAPISAPMPAPITTNYNTSYNSGNSSLQHEFRSGSSVIQPVVIHDYKGADTSFGSYSTYSPAYSSGSYSPMTYTPPGEYVSAAPIAYDAYSPAISRGSHIILEPEIRREYVSAAPISAGPMTTLSPSYTTIAPTQYISQMPTIQATSIPAVSTFAAPTETVVYSSAPTTVYASAPTYTTETYTSSAPTLYSASNILQPTVISAQPTVITPGSASIIQNTVSGDLSGVQGLRLVKSYQDSKFATNMTIG